MKSSRLGAKIQKISKIRRKSQKMLGLSGGTLLSFWHALTKRKGHSTARKGKKALVREGKKVLSV